VGLMDTRPKRATKKHHSMEVKRQIAQLVIARQDKLTCSSRFVSGLAGKYGVNPATVYEWANLERSGRLTERQPKREEITYEMLTCFWRHHGVFKATWRDLKAKGLWAKSEERFRTAMHREVDHLLLLAANMDEQAARLLGAFVYHEASDRNSEWEIDSKVLPVLVEADNGELIKPTATLIVDAKTRLKPGYFLHVGAPNSSAVAAALVNAMRRRSYEVPVAEDGPVLEILIGGAPDMLTHDNGTEFLSDHLGHALVDWAIVSNAVNEKEPTLKGKIEAYNRHVDDWASQFAPWTMSLEDRRGGKPFREIDGLRVLTAEEFEWLFERFMHHCNFEHVHRTTGQTPFGRWAEHAVFSDPDQGLRFVDETLLERHLLQRIGTRKIKRGCVQVNKRRYVARELPHVAAGEVEIRVADHDGTFVECWDGNAFVARAYECTSLTDAQIDALLDDRSDFEETIRELRRDGVRQLAADQAELARHVAEHLATDGADLEAEGAQPASPEASASPASGGQDLLDLLDRTFKKEADDGES
jgi:transposase InsO family protein